MLGRDDEYHERLERAHHAHRDAGETACALRAARSGSAMTLLRGETGPRARLAGSAQRLVEGGTATVPSAATC